MTPTRQFVLGAVLLLALGGCGADSAGDSPALPARETLTLPDVDEKTADSADAAHTSAIKALLSSPFTYTGSVKTPMGTVSVSGAVDPARERSRLTMTLPPRGGSDDLELMELETESVFVDDRAYVRIAVGEAKKCWFDYGSNSPLIGDVGWIPGSLAAVDGYARGYVRGTDDTLVLDADAVNLVGAVLPKAGRQMYTDDDVPVPVVIGIEDGRIASAEYDLGRAVEALIAAGVSQPDGVTEDDVLEAIGGVVRIEFNPEDAVDIVAPSSDLLIDASGLSEDFDPDDPDDPVEPCPAAA